MREPTASEEAEIIKGWEKINRSMEELIPLVEANTEKLKYIHASFFGMIPVVKCSCDREHTDECLKCNGDGYVRVEKPVTPTPPLECSCDPAYSHLCWKCGGTGYLKQ
jgi:hypothetical protein